MENISYISFMTQTQYEDYFVNESGDVFSMKKGNIKKLKGNNAAKGYLQVCIWNNNKAKFVYVHRLVAQTFIPNPDSKPEVNHKNGIKTDNRLENLEWNTSKENINHAHKLGLSNAIGENHGMAKLTEEDVLQIRELRSKKTFNQTKLAEMYGVSNQLISNIINNKRWKHI